ncbi:MAG: hypothetical protein MUF39_02275 [Cyclobacteriaceae bacterium]|jgi:hypothetical protein|nr:hypothetical protein [Cyclobacteriaceae bacterium]
MFRVIFYLLLSAALVAAVIIAGNFLAWWTMPTYWIEILAVNFFITVVLYAYLLKVQTQQPQIFTQFYLLSIALKMVGGLTLITYIVWDAPGEAIGNVVTFISSYLIFTMVEVSSLLKKVS